VAGFLAEEYGEWTYLLAIHLFPGGQFIAAKRACYTVQIEQPINYDPPVAICRWKFQRRISYIPTSVAQDKLAITINGNS
jgi:hypothetical protein